MLYLQFFADDNRYVIAIKQISEVVPFVNLKTIPSLPGYAAGLLDYHGESVPVIDMCYLLSDRPCSRKLSTRIILAYVVEKNNTNKLLGLLVEKATETCSVDNDGFVDPGMHNPDLPFIGSVLSDGSGVVTRVSPQDVFNIIDKTLFYPDELSPDL